MPAISQSRLQRQFNELILVRVAVFREGLEDLREKKGSDGWQKSCWKGPEEGNPGDHPRRAGVYFVSSSAGIRLQNNEPIGQLLRQVAKTG